MSIHYLRHRFATTNHSFFETLAKYVAVSALIITGIFHPIFSNRHIVDAASISPSDMAKSTVLKVPYYAQQYKNSCEAASLRMVLEFYGIKVKGGDMELVQAFGYKPRLKDELSNVWDDPRQMYVGFVNGQSGTGYGVYGQPVERVAEQYGREAEFTTDIVPSQFAAEIRAGHPIVIWGYTSLTTAPYTWSLPGGGEIRAFRGEHARVVVGVQGPTDKPTGFYLHDPFTGKSNIFWTTAELMRHMHSVLGVTNQAVIIR